MSSKLRGGIEFDKYQRYGIALRILEALRGRLESSPIKVIDVAGEQKLLSTLFSGKELIFYSLDKVFKNLEYEDDSFDVSLCLDVLEHLAREHRAFTLRELLRVTRYLIILSFPIDEDEVNKAEEELKAILKLLRSERFLHHLEEHRRYGLPRMEEVEEVLKSWGVSYQVVRHGNVYLWKSLTLLQFLASQDPRLLSLKDELKRYYVSELYDVDVFPPTYRAFIVVSKRLDLLEGLPDLFRQPSPTDAIRVIKFMDRLYQGVLEFGLRSIGSELFTLREALEVERSQRIRLQYELENILDSLAWRFAHMLSRLSKRLFPEGTLRGRVFSKFKRFVKIALDEGLSVALKKSWNYLIDKTELVKTTEVLCPIDLLQVQVVEAKEVTLRQGDSLRLRLSFGPIYKFPNIKLSEELFITLRYRGGPLRLICEADGRKLRETELPFGEGSSEVNVKLGKLSDDEIHDLIIELRQLEGASVWDVGKWTFARGEAEVSLSLNGKPVNGTIAFSLSKLGASKDPYKLWIAQNEPLEPDLERQRELERQLKYRPKISIIMPTWNTPPGVLRRAIESVLSQTYSNWELCIADGNSQESTREVLREYAQRDERIKVRFLDENLGISGNSNEALKLATGEFIALLDHDDTLAPFALYEVVKLLNERPDLDFIYSDSDKISESGERKEPFFKPDFSPDLFHSINYLIHLTVIRRELVEKVGGFRSEYDGSQDYDLFLRVLEHTTEDRIAHIPKVLYHWRLMPSSASLNVQAKPYALLSAKKALSESLRRRGYDVEVTDGLWMSSYRVRYLIKGRPKVSIIIPTKDKVDILRKCVESIIEKTTYPNYEITIVDNASQEQATFDYYEELKGDDRFKILSYPHPFNFSAIVNYAVGQVDTEYVLLLNNDVEVISPEWLEAMLEHAQRPEVGAVGAKLLYPNGLIQHAGVVLGIGSELPVAGHAFKYLREDQSYFNLANVIRNYSAVTAACMLTKRSVFLEVGGFDEENLAVAFNDVDYCLKLRERGYLIVYTPYAKLYHHESLTRGYEDTPEKQARFRREIEHMRRKWGHVLDSDPYYNPNLTKLREDFSIHLRTWKGEVI